MKKLLLPLFAAGALLLSGCLESATLVDVKKDGSGTMTIRMFMSDQMTQGLQGLAGAFGGEAAGGEAPDIAGEMLKEMSTKLKSAGEGMGEGVTFAAGKDVTNKAGWKGYEALFNFTDINKLKAGLFSNKDGDDEAGAGRPGPKLGGDDAEFAFTFTPGEVATLEIINTKAGEADAGDAPAGGAPEQMNAAMLGMMKPMLAGMRMSFLIRVDGEVVETNGNFRPGNKNAFVMMDVDMAKLFEDEEATKKLMGGPANLKQAIDLPGFKMQDPSKPMVIKFR